MTTLENYSVFKNINIVTPEPPYTNKNYKPNLEKIINKEGSVFVVELFKGHFRIIRLFNQKRTHDFIINNFKDCQIYVENGNSQDVIFQLKSIQDLQYMFKDAKIYRNHKGPGITGNLYIYDKSSLITIETLLKEWYQTI